MDSGTLAARQRTSGNRFVQAQVAPRDVEQGFSPDEGLLELAMLTRVKGPSAVPSTLGAASKEVQRALGDAVAPQIAVEPREGRVIHRPRQAAPPVQRLVTNLVTDHKTDVDGLLATGIVVDQMHAVWAHGLDSGASHCDHGDSLSRLSGVEQGSRARLDQTGGLMEMAWSCGADFSCDTDFINNLKNTMHPVNMNQSEASAKESELADRLDALYPIEAGIGLDEAAYRIEQRCRARLQSGQAKDPLDSRWLLAEVSGNFAEANRLAALIDRRSRTGIRVV